MGRGLPKKYAKMGFAKGWKEYRKVHKGGTTKRKVVGVKKMTRRRRRYTRKRRRRAKPKIPLEVAVALGAIPFTPSWDGAKSLLGDAQAGDFEGIARQLKCGFLGFTPDGKIDILGTLNPFDENRARYVKMLIIAGILSKVRKSLVKIPFKKVPLIGKYIS